MEKAEEVGNLGMQKVRTRKAKHLKRQRGFSTLQVVAAIAIAGVLTAAAARVLFPMYNRALVNNGYEELYLIINSVNEIREYHGDYALLGSGGVAGFTWLVDNGYLPTDRYTDGTGENSFGGNIELTSTNGNDDAELKYSTNSISTCENLADRMITIAGVKRTAGTTNPDAICDSQTLTVKIN
jgi:type II secretory pathway pseudopilin PulG